MNAIQLPANNPHDKHASWARDMSVSLFSVGCGGVSYAGDVRSVSPM